MQQSGAQMMNSGYQMQQPGVQPMNAPYGEYGQEPVPKKKKGGRIFAIILSVVLVLGIAAGAAYWYFFMRGDNKTPVEETMDRFCTSVEELNIRDMMNCMFTDDMMDILDTYMVELGLSFDQLQEVFMSGVASYGNAEALENMDISYRVVGDPVEIKGDEFDSLVSKMKMFFITDVEKIIKADIALTSIDDTESTLAMYFYCVKEKWYMFPEEMFESDIYDSLF